MQKKIIIGITIAVLIMLGIWWVNAEQQKKAALEADQKMTQEAEMMPVQDEVMPEKENSMPAQDGMAQDSSAGQDGSMMDNGSAK